jgi:hypothetical protein
MDICIRTWRSVIIIILLDYGKGLHELAAQSPRVVALSAHLHFKLSYVEYILTTIGLIISVRSTVYRLFGLMLAFCASAAFVIHRYLLSKIYTAYYLLALKEPDLTNIALHYQLEPVSDTGEYIPRGPSCFWVVEQVLPDGRADIIGMGGLGVYKTAPAPIER